MKYTESKSYDNVIYSNCYGTKISLVELEEAIQLIPNCLDGCYRAQKRLYDIFAQPMLTLCLRFTKGNLSRAQDIAQEAFAKVYTYLHSLRSSRALHVWITRVFYSEAMDNLRYAKRAKHSPHFLVSPIEEDMALVADESEFEFRHDLDTLLCIYVHRHTRLFKLAANGYSYLDIGRELQMPEGTVKCIISRERARIKSYRAPFYN